MDLTLRDVTRVVGSAVKTVADVAVDKAREMAEGMGARPQHRCYRGREGHQGPPKIESGYYSTGRMVGFGSDSMPRSGSGGYGNDSHSSAAGYGGATVAGASKWAEEERQLRERRLAARTGYANRDAYDRDEFDERDDHGDTDRFDGYSSRSAYDHGKEDELSRRAASGGGYAVPGAPTYTTQRQEHNRQQAPSQSHVPRIESGYYSSGRMEGFGSDDVRGRGGYDRGRGGAGGGGGATPTAQLMIGMIAAIVWGRCWKCRSKRLPPSPLRSKNGSPRRFAVLRLAASEAAPRVVYSRAMAQSSRHAARTGGTATAMTTATVPMRGRRRSSLSPTARSESCRRAMCAQPAVRGRGGSRRRCRVRMCQSPVSLRSPGWPWVASGPASPRESVEPQSRCPHARVHHEHSPRGQTDGRAPRAASQATLGPPASAVAAQTAMTTPRLKPQPPRQTF